MKVQVCRPVQKVVKCVPTPLHKRKNVKIRGGIQVHFLRHLRIILGAPLHSEDETCSTSDSVCNFPTIKRKIFEFPIKFENFSIFFYLQLTANTKGC